jgi:hypothetical protein
MAKPRKRETGSSVLEREEGAPQFAGDTTAANADRERIAERAYQLYMARGGRDGSDVDDWLEAEREVAGNQGRDGSKTVDPEI